MQRPFSATLRKLGFTLSEDLSRTGASLAGGEDGAKEEGPEEGSELTVSRDLKLGRGRVLCGVHQQGQESQSYSWQHLATVDRDRQGQVADWGFQPFPVLQGRWGQSLCSLEHCKDSAVFLSFEKTAQHNIHTQHCLCKILVFFLRGFCILILVSSTQLAHIRYSVTA